MLQDDIFGKAKQDQDKAKWIYAAEIKQEEIKSYFNYGKGNQPHKHDFGETYDNIREVGLFLWEKKAREILRLKIN